LTAEYIEKLESGQAIAEIADEEQPEETDEKKPLKPAKVGRNL